MLDLSHETEVLAQRLADAQSVSIDTAVRQALEASACAAGLHPAGASLRDRSPQAVARRRKGIDRVIRELAALPVLDNRSPRTIMDDLNNP